MLSIFIALLSAIAVAAVFKLSHLVHGYWGLVPPALIAFIGVTVLMFRRAAGRLDPMVKSVEKHLAGGRRELAIKTLREGLALGRWHPLLAGQLHAQIGAIEYVAGDLDAAEEELSRASRYPWVSRAFLGCVYFKRRDEKKMRQAFDVAVKVGAKEGIVWTLYAYCLIARGQRDEAVKMLEQGLKKNPGDHRLEANLELAKEGKRLKTAPYGDSWARFALDGEGPVLPKAARGFNPRPGFRQRPKRR
jgi:tetratricopeptide (TPR) repeat protein